MEEGQILEKLWERYELSHSDAHGAAYRAGERPKATRRIGELNRSIKGLGTPNIGAIEEFDRVNTRYTYLSTADRMWSRPRRSCWALSTRSPSR